MTPAAICSSTANESCSNNNNNSPIMVVGPYDILCGRDKLAFNNIGNRRFRTTISLNLDRYRMAETRFQKTAIIHSVLDMLRTDVGARFLKKNSEAGTNENTTYVELDEKEARAKVGHAFRDMIAVQEQQHQQQQRRSARSSTSTTRSSTTTTRSSTTTMSAECSNYQEEFFGGDEECKPTPAARKKQKQKRSSLSAAVGGVLSLFRGGEEELMNEQEQETIMYVEQQDETEARAHQNAFRDMVAAQDQQLLQQQQVPSSGTTMNTECRDFQDEFFGNDEECKPMPAATKEKEKRSSISDAVGGVLSLFRGSEEELLKEAEQEQKTTTNEGLQLQHQESILQAERNTWPTKEEHHTAKRRRQSSVMGAALESVLCLFRSNEDEDEEISCMEHGEDEDEKMEEEEAYCSKLRNEELIGSPITQQERKRASFSAALVCFLQRGEGGLEEEEKSISMDPLSIDDGSKLHEQERIITVTAARRASRRKSQRSSFSNTLDGALSYFQRSGDEMTMEEEKSISMDSLSIADSWKLHEHEQERIITVTAARRASRRKSQRSSFSSTLDGALSYFQRSGDEITTEEEKSISMDPLSIDDGIILHEQQERIVTVTAARRASRRKSQRSSFSATLDGALSYFQRSGDEMMMEEEKSVSVDSLPLLDDDVACML